MHRIPLYLTLLCACGSPPTSLDLARPVDSAMSLLSDAGAVDAAGGSGDMVSLPSSRVVVEYSVVDGQRLPIGFYDTTLDARCQLNLTSAGLRCIPDGGVASYFLDAACTQSTAAAVMGCPTLKFAISASASCGGFRVFRLGAATTQATYYINTGVSCLASPSPPTYIFYPVVAEIDPTTLSPGSYVH